jgi:glutamate--cysteine ligase
LFLHPLMEIALANETPAERKLALYHGVWNGDIDQIFKQFAY